MPRYAATAVDVRADTEHGEGWVVFRWPHDRYGYEEMRIDLDGHCSRRMPVHSGTGPPEFVRLHRDGVRLRFDPPLAEKLRLAPEIEITFSIPNGVFADLRRVVEYFNGACG